MSSRLAADLVVRSRRDSQHHHPMKTRTVTLGILAIVVLSLSIRYTYHLGFSRGSADERLHWIVSIKDGGFTARENPEHPILKGIVSVDRGVPGVNSIPVTYSP